MLRCLPIHDRQNEATIANVEVDRLGFVSDVDAQRFSRGVIRVDQRLATAQEEKIGAAKLKRAAERRLETRAVALHPRRMLRGLSDRRAGELLVGESAGH